MHPSHYGRMCPIETPEGPNIGLIGDLSTYARVNRFGFIETPYRKVDQRRVTDEIDYLAADDEDEYVIAQANAPVERRRRVHRRAGARRRPAGGDAVRPQAAARARRLRCDHRHQLRRPARGRLHGRLAEADRLGRHGAHPVPRARRRQPRAHGREHAAPGRARCSAPRRRTSAPASRRVPPATPRPGPRRGGRHRRRRRPATRSRSTTRPAASAPTGCQVPPVEPGHLHQPEAPRVRGRPRQARATSSPTVRRPTPGELALGKNLLVAFMPWKGHNFEDAIVLSERLVRDDVLTSIHIEEHEIDARDTKLGAEEITRDIPNLSEKMPAGPRRARHHPHRRRGRSRRHPRRQGHAEGRDRAHARGAPAPRDLR